MNNVYKPGDKVWTNYNRFDRTEYYPAVITAVIKHTDVIKHFFSENETALSYSYMIKKNNVEQKRYMVTKEQVRKRTKPFDGF